MRSTLMALTGVLLGAGLTLGAPLALAQGGVEQRATAPGAPPRDSAGQERARVERQLNARIGSFLRRALALTDEQYNRLSATNARYETERRRLVAGERATRLELRAQLQRGDAADQGRVASLIDALIAQQRSRLDLLEREQRELATFLTPVQRAKFAAVQERIRRRVEQLRSERLRGKGRPGGSVRRRGGLREPAGDPRGPR